MDKQEKIVCAAVKFDYMIHSEVVICLDYDDNRVRDHISNDISYGVIGEKTHGFITNKNRFVDPKNAFVIAVNAGQISPYGGNDIPELKPSDLY